MSEISDCSEPAQQQGSEPSRSLEAWQARESGSSLGAGVLSNEVALYALRTPQGGRRASAPAGAARWCAAHQQRRRFPPDETGRGVVQQLGADSASIPAWCWT